MGIIAGTPKYIIGVLLTTPGFIAMYIFGGSLITLFNTIGHLFSGNFIEAFIESFVKSALPPTSIGKVFFQAFIGACVAGMSWFIAMARRGVSF